jgi:copper chaperone
MFPGDIMETTRIKVEGMTCGGCVASVKRALEQIDGVGNVDVSLDQAQARVDYDPARVNESQLRSAIEDAGFDAR